MNNNNKTNKGAIKMENGKTTIEMEKEYTTLKEYREFGLNIDIEDFALLTGIDTKRIESIENIQNLPTEKEFIALFRFNKDLPMKIFKEFFKEFFVKIAELEKKLNK